MLSSCSIYDEFVKKATERAQNKKVGDPFDTETEQGPQVSFPSLPDLCNHTGASNVSESSSLINHG